LHEIALAAALPMRGLAARRLYLGLPLSGSRVPLTFVDGMAPAFADEPGIEPAPQSAHARTTDRLTVDWLNQHLIHSR
jgi:hypothetical protein